MGAGKFDIKHGVGIMLNKSWRQRIIDIELINERAITTCQPITHQIDECVLSPLEMCGPSH